MNNVQKETPLTVFLGDFSRTAGKRGILTAGYILAGAVFEGIGISLLVPLLGILFGGAGVPHWLQAGTTAGFALVGAHSRVSRLLVLLGIFAVLIALRAIVVSARDFAIFRLQLEFMQAQQLRTARALASSSWEYLTRLRHARVSHLISADVQKLGVGIHFLLRGGVAALVLMVQCTLAFLFAPALAAIVAALLILGAFCAAPLIARSRSIGDYVADANLSLLDTTAQFMGGLKLAMSQDLQPEFVHRVRQMLQNLADRQFWFARQQALGQGGMIALSGIMGLAAVFAGLFWFQVAPALLIAFLLVVARMMAPMEQVHQAAQQFTHLLAVYGRMRSFERELSEVTPAPRFDTEHRCPTGNIVFENVTYQHVTPPDGQKPETGRGGVRNLEVTIRQGEFLAITGPSGIGKTTFADLLAGLYAPQSGNVIVGTQVLDGAIARVWRKELAYCPQDPFLFHDSIRRNLSWASPHAQESDMWRALATAGVDRFVQQMARGLDSVVGERGSLVSGGERQRIALARALLRNPTLLILDEATNALDGESERDILIRLSMLLPRPTIVLIAQRIENLAACDRVIRLDRAEERTVASVIVSCAATARRQPGRLSVANS